MPRVPVVGETIETVQGGERVVGETIETVQGGERVALKVKGVVFKQGDGEDFTAIAYARRERPSEGHFL